MSGIYESAVTATAGLSCNKGDCTQSWRSKIYQPTRWQSSVDACAPAFAEGWRVFVGKRTQHAYCPAHGPAVEMRQIHPAVPR